MVLRGEGLGWAGNGSAAYPEALLNQQAVGEFSGETQAGGPRCWQDLEHYRDVLPGKGAAGFRKGLRSGYYGADINGFFWAEFLPSSSGEELAPKLILVLGRI